MKKYLKVMLVLVVVLTMLSTVAFAGSFDIKPGDGGAINTKVNTLAGTIISIITTIGYAVAVIMVLVTGVQYLMGTPAKKQELKGKLWSIVIGVVLLVGASTLLNTLESTITGVLK